MWAAVPRSSAGGRREATMVRDFSEIPRGRRARDLLPAGGRRLSRLADVGAELPIAGPDAAARVTRELRGRRSAAGPADALPIRLAAAERGRGLLDRSSARRLRAYRRSASSLVRELEDDGEPGYGYLIYPHRPIVASTRAAASCCPSSASASPTAASRRRRRAAARRRRRARQVDGAAGGRARADRRGERAPARPPARSRTGAPRPRPPQRVDGASDGLAPPQ